MLKLNICNALLGGSRRPEIRSPHQNKSSWSLMKILRDASYNMIHMYIGPNTFFNLPISGQNFAKPCRNKILFIGNKNDPVFRSGGWLVGWLVGRSVCHNFFYKGSKFKFLVLSHCFRIWASQWIRPYWEHQQAYSRLLSW